MTAVFGQVENRASSARTIVAASTSASGRAELHEMAMGADGTMVMRPIVGGIEVPAGGSADLAPGGKHIMLMDLARTLVPGEQIDVTLTLDDGTTTSFAAIVKEFAGGDENYDGESADAPASSAASGATSGATSSSMSHP